MPHELTAQQKEWLIKDFVRETFVRQGMIADVNIHAPHENGDERNYHVHCLLTMRKLDGRRLCQDEMPGSGTGRDELEAWREKWAHMGARALERAGFKLEAERWRHGHETLEKQREAALERGRS